MIVAPPNAKVTIYTDSQNALNTWSQLESRNYNSHIRQIFKQSSNYIIWNHISEIISTLNLVINIIYVKAHSGNVWNDFIDKKCSEVHYNNESSIITLSTEAIDNIAYTLR